MTPAYAAGLFDGEGCVYVNVNKRSRHYAPTASIGMSDRALPVLTAMAEAHGGKVRRFRPATKKWAAAYVWRVDGRTAANFLRLVLPHLEVKAEQARLAIRLQDIIDALPQRSAGMKSWTDEARERANAIWLRIKELNRKGPSLEVAPPMEGARLFAHLVGGQWVSAQRDLFSDLGWEPLSESFPSSGIMRRGALWMLNSSEWPSDGDGFSLCSLSQVLEPNVPPKYFLSAKAAAGILRRAAKRGRELPPALRRALEGLAGTGAASN
jgi:hypothetical protein